MLRACVQRPDDFAAFVRDLQPLGFRHRDNEPAQVVALFEEDGAFHLALVDIERSAVSVVRVVDQDLVAIEADRGDPVTGHLKDDRPARLQFRADLALGAGARAHEADRRRTRFGPCDLAGEFVDGGPDHVPVGVAAAHPAVVRFRRLRVEPSIDRCRGQCRAIGHGQQAEQRHHGRDGGHGAAALLNGRPAPVRTELRVFRLRVLVARPRGVGLLEQRRRRPAAPCRDDLLRCLYRIVFVAHVDARVGGFGVRRFRAAAVVQAEFPGQGGHYRDGQQHGEQCRFLPAFQRRNDGEQAIGEHRVGIDMRWPGDYLVGQHRGPAEQLSLRLTHAEAHVSLLARVEVQRRQLELVLQLCFVVRAAECVVGHCVAIVLRDKREIALRTERLDAHLRPFERQHRDLPEGYSFALKVERGDNHRVVELAHEGVRRLRRLDDDRDLLAGAGQEFERLVADRHPLRRQVRNGHRHLVNDSPAVVDHQPREGRHAGLDWRWRVRQVETDDRKGAFVRRFVVPRKAAGEQ